MKAGNDAFGLGSQDCSVKAPVASVCVIESLPVWTRRPSAVQDAEPGRPGIIVVMHLFIILLLLLTLVMGGRGSSVGCDCRAVLMFK